MKSKKHHIFLICLAVCSLLFCGCNKDFKEGTPFDKSNNESATPSPSSTPTDTPSQSTDTSSKPSDEPIASEKPDESVTPSVADKPEETPENTGVTTKPEETTPTPEESIPTPSGSEPDPVTDTEPSPTIPVTDTEPDDETPEINRDSFDRDEYWQMSYLIWLPYFDKGSFISQRSEGTYDYAVFTKVSVNEVLDYISSLKKSGFTVAEEDKITSESIIFSAFNDNSWNATLSYDGTELILGSGFKENASSEDEILNNLYSTTMLQYIPRFEAGKYVSSEVLTDSSMYAYVIYDNISEEDVSDYISRLKESGYIYVTDENSENGSLWYIALNEERFECHVEFDGSALKIGCGISEDD